MAGEGAWVEVVRSRVRAVVSSGRLLRFASVGLVGTTVDFSVLIALVELWDVRLELAKVTGAELAILVMFTLNERWTFSEWGKAGYRSLLGRLLTSNLVRLAGITVATIVLSLLVRFVGVPYLLANLVGIGFGFVVNFSAESLVTWRVHK